MHVFLLSDFEDFELFDEEVSVITTEQNSLAANSMLPLCK